MRIRKAAGQDAAAIMDVRCSVLENALTRDQLAALGITEASIETMLATTHAGWCGEIDGKVVAFSMADREQGSIFALFVRPDFEGRGLGSALLREAVSFLASLGHERLTLTTEPGTRALKFYLSHGWRQTGVDKRGEAQLEFAAGKA